MGAYDCWQEQKGRLRLELRDCADARAAAYRVRHAVAQVEQNTMAAQTDDLLRQQTGVLFSCLKTAVGLLDVTVATKVWVAQSIAEKPKKSAFWLPLALSAALMLFSGLLAYGRGEWLTWVPLAAALILLIVGALGLRARKPERPAEDDLRVTAQPDTDKLFGALDAQMQAIDRHINDFAYLNEQSRSRDDTPDQRNLDRVADMLEALYECEGEARAQATEAADRLLRGMGMEAIEYAPADARLFTVLPSKSVTRTLVPALVSSDDRRLLRRGTAAVSQVA